MAKDSAEDECGLERVDKIRSWFEGRQAIYLEKDVLLVRVSNIRGGDYIEADIEEIPTAGLPVYLPAYDRSGQPRPLRWKIGTNFETHFSPDYWSSQHGRWCMRFSSKLIEEVLVIASQFPEDHSPAIGYRQIRRYIDNQTTDALLASLKEAKPSKRLGGLRT